MPNARRSKLDAYREQIVEWIRQGKDTRTIASKLGEMGMSVTHVAVGNYVRKAMGDTLATAAKKADGVLLKSADEAIAMINRAIAFLEEKDGLSQSERAKWSEQGQWVDRLGKWAGWTKESAGVNVAVITESRASIIASFIESLPEELRAKLRDAVRS